jgi:hypothetical protein
MAEHLALIVRVATAGDPGCWRVSALACRRRPGRRPCPGHLAVLCTDIPPSIEWRCTSCQDEGVISGWERSPFDLRFHGTNFRPTGAVRAVIPAEVAATLRDLKLLDTASERLVFRSTVLDDGVVLSGDEDEIDELLGCVAAEANHEDNRRRQKRLDTAFEVLNEALTQTQRS